MFYDVDTPPYSSTAQLARLQHNFLLHFELLSLLAGQLAAHVLRTARMPANTPEVKQQLKIAGACPAIVNHSEKNDECLVAILALTTGGVAQFRAAVANCIGFDLKERFFVPQDPEDIDRIAKLIPS